MAHPPVSSDELSNERPPLMEVRVEVRPRPSSPKEADDDAASQAPVVSSPCSSSSSVLPCKSQGSRSATTSAEESGCERLKRHRVEMAGRVWIPDIWGQEDLLKDWIDCSAFDACLMPSGIMSARNALVEEGRRTSSGGLRIENRC